MSTLDLTADAHLVRRATSKGVRSHVDRFTARYDYLYHGKAVLATETSTDVWEITAFPGVDTVQATTEDGGFTFAYRQDFTFYGGKTYTVTGSLATALTNAGYEVS